jgi:hypothetical protein
MAEFKVTTPRLKAAPMQSNKDIGIGIGEKGGISLYVRGQRFPVTLYQDQWRMLLEEETVAELVTFIDEHQDLLAATPTRNADQGKPENGYAVNKADIALVAAEAERLTLAGDVAGAVKFHTIKSVAELGQRVTPEQLFAVMELKIRPKA